MVRRRRALRAPSRRLVPARYPKAVSTAPTPDTPSDHVLVMALLAPGRSVRAESVVENFNRRWPKMPIAVDRSGDWTAEGATFRLLFDGGFCMVGHMDVPFPERDRRSACAVSWMWPEAEERTRGHGSHIVCFGNAAGGALEQRLMFTRILAAICAAGGVVAVYWGDANLMHEPTRFVAIAEEGDLHMMAAMLWVSARVSKNWFGRFTATTHGLHKLGHKDFEILKARRTPGELLELLGDLTLYVLHNGPVLKHGQTFGRSAEERHRIEHRRSRFGNGEVIGLRMG
jgi:hypothetical protein